MNGTTFPSMPAVPPAPGIYHDVAAPDYFRWAAWSQSTLKDFGEWDNYTQSIGPGPMKSPAHVLAALHCPPEPTDAQEFGSAYHCLLMEPQRFKEQVKVLKEPVNRRTNAGKAEWAQLCELYGEHNLVEPDDWKTLQAMAHAAAAHPKALKLLGTAGRREVSMVWTDEVTGETCRGRLDKLIIHKTTEGERHLIVDLKTTRCSHWRDFEKDAAKYGYHIQAAMYCDGYEALTGARPDYFIIAQEKTAPYPCATYKVRPEMIDSGRVVYRAALALAKKCRETNTWPAYADDRIVDLDLPAWAQADATAE